MTGEHIFEKKGCWTIKRLELFHILSPIKARLKQTTLFQWDVHLTLNEFMTMGDKRQVE